MHAHCHCHTAPSRFYAARPMHQHVWVATAMVLLTHSVSTSGDPTSATPHLSASALYDMTSAVVADALLQMEDDDEEDADSEAKPRYYAKYHGYLASRGCLDFDQGGAAGSALSLGADNADNAVSLEPCRVGRKTGRQSGSYMESHLTHYGTDFTVANTRCWTCTGYDDLLYFDTKDECAHAVAVLHSAVPYLTCHEAHLFDQYVFLLYSDTMDDDMRFLTPLLDRFAKTSPECSGNGTLDQETGTCHCKMGFLGDACDIVAFDGID